MSWLRYVAGIAAILAITASALAADEGTPPSESLSGSELLLFQEIPEVITAAKELQPIIESPAAVTIITAEDIRRSGASNLPDLFRMVPGVEVMEATASDFNISTRGFNRVLANKMLVLVDGRSVYQDMLGVTLWETLPLVLDDIERIEVVRGPGSALYGANAFDGVINIITKTPRESPKLALTRITGNHDLDIASLTHSGRVSAVDYKLSVASDRLGAWDETANAVLGLDPLSHKMTRWNASAQGAVGAGVLTGYVGASNGRLQLVPDEGWGGMDYQSDLDYCNLVYEQPDLLVRGFYNHGEQVVVVDPDAWVEFHTYDLEIEKNLQLAADHSLIVGATWRRNKVDMSEEQDYVQRIYGIYAQDHYTNDKGVSVIAGLRFDHHPLTGNHVSPRASVVYSPRKGESYRASVASAYRNPSFFENYLDLKYHDIMPGLALWWFGNPDLGAEKITSYELGYQRIVSLRLRLGVSAFYNKLDDFITMIRYIGRPGYLYTTYVNGGGATAKGTEAELEFALSPTVRGFANYSYQYVTDDDTGARIGSAPRHKVNLGLRHTSSRFTADAIVDHVSSTEWSGNYLPSYTLTNARVGYTPGPGNVEFFLAAFNLFKDSHREFPVGVEIGRRITGGVHYRF
jgi:iron complex outermembrane receptor protein